MRPLIIVNHRLQTTRALRCPPAPPVFLTVTTPLRDHRPSQTQMISTGQGLRARTTTTRFAQGAKTSITRQHPPRHPANRPTCLRPPRLQCPVLHVLRTLLPQAPPLQTPNVGTAHLPTVLLAQMPPILPAVFSPQAPRTPQQAASQRQSLDFQSPPIGRSSLRRDNNLALSLIL